jgi:Syntaxin 6, N-terminal
VLKTIDAANSLYQRWRELVNSSQTSQEDCEWTANELRNCLRSIDWDLEDLEETIHILFLLAFVLFSSTSYDWLLPVCNNNSWVIKTCLQRFSP